MKTAITAFIVLLLAGSGLAIALGAVDHNHGSDAVISHAGSLDGNGCHHGAGGYHCH